jgi:hypothetical protein
MPRSGFQGAPRSPERLALMRPTALRSGPAAAGVETAPLIFQELPAAAPEALPLPVVASRSGEAVKPDVGTHGQRAVPRRLEQAVTFYHAQGDVVEAERTLREAHRLCKKTLGPQHRTTQWTARQLAGVYQAALNTGETATLPPAGALPATPRFARREHDPRQGAYFRARATARQVREQITARPAREVSARVVPVLIQALETSSDTRERQALVRALGELGPAARPAVPVLAARLRKCSEPTEQRALLEALAQMGPAARDAVGVLTALATAAEDPARAKTGVVPTADDCPCRLAGDELKLARKVLARLTGTQAQVGVFDAAGLFSVRAGIDATRALQQVLRHKEIAVRIETLSGPPDAPRLARDVPGPQTLHVYLARTGAQVHVSSALRDRGLDAQQLAAQLAVLCKKNEPDRALTTVVTRVKALEGTAKKTKRTGNEEE